MTTYTRLVVLAYAFFRCLQVVFSHQMDKDWNGDVNFSVKIANGKIQEARLNSRKFVRHQLLDPKTVDAYKDDQLDIDKIDLRSQNPS